MPIEDHNSLLLEIIFSALKGYVIESQPGNKLNYTDEEIDCGKFSYLLGQSIRHWIIPPENWHTSKAALKVWKIISGQDSMPHYRYKESFKTEKNLAIPRFKGANRDFGKLEPLILDKTERYVFNDIFVAEHTIPVADIMDALKEYYNANPSKSDSELKEGIRPILNKIHITQMLKIEERRIKHSHKRVPKIMKSKTISCTICDYLANNNDIFENIRKEFYSNLKPSFEKKLDISRFLKGIMFVEQKKYKTIPHWAKAIDLSKPYTIEIAK